MEQEIDILLIEDNPHEAELTIRSLRKHHLTDRLLHIDDGAEAIGFIRSRRQVLPKLVLLDLKLPKVDGLEILRELKSNARTRMIPVVVLTSSKEERDIVDSYKLGVNSYIVKPVNFESFAKAVSELGLYWMIMNQNVPNQ